MKKIYCVKYTYSTSENNTEDDIWFLAKNNEGEIHELMEHNKKLMNEYGMDILNYSFHTIQVEGYDIQLIKRGWF